MGIVPQIVHEKPGESPVPRCFIENRARWVRNCAWAQMKVGPKSGVFGTCWVHKSTWRWVFGFDWSGLFGWGLLPGANTGCCATGTSLFHRKSSQVGQKLCLGPNEGRPKIRCFGDLPGPQKHLGVGVWLRLEHIICHGTVSFCLSRVIWWFWGIFYSSGCLLIFCALWAQTGPKFGLST